MAESPFYFKTQFVEGVLHVFENSLMFVDRPMIHQPHNPNNGQPWANEQEALDWWETQKIFYGPPLSITDPTNFPEFGEITTQTNQVVEG